MSQAKIEQALLTAGLIDDLQLRSARHHQQKWGGTIGKAVVEKGFAGEGSVVNAIAAALGLTRAELGLVRKDAAALAKIPVEVAEAKGVFPIALRDNGKTLIVAMPDPTNLDLTDTLLRTTRCRIKAQVAGEGEIAQAIRVHYHGGAAGGFSQPMRQGVDSVRHGPSPVGEEGAEETTQVPTGDAPPPPPVMARTDYSPGPAQDVDGALDELLGKAPAGEFTGADLARLDQIRANQEKGSRVLQAVIDLCLEKGLISSEEHRDRIKRR
jgi:hypothetical protein